jgi:hypothetical protein
MRGRRSRRDERGAILLLVSLIMTVLLFVVAFVIDLGTARSTKRDTQAIADLAALDAGYYLSGSSRSGVGIAQPQQACIAAIESAQRNVSGFLDDLTRDDIEAECAHFPETIDECDPDSVLDPVVLVDGERQLTIRYPIPKAELESGRFPSGGTRDGEKPCERIGVDLSKVTGTAFGGITGVGEMTTHAGAVVRGTTDIYDGTPPAVLLLERTDCKVFGNSVSGNGNEGIVVEAFEETPGLIHADTNATTNCTGTSSGAFGIYGTSLSGGGPSIVVADGALPADGSPRRPGAIRTAATNGKGAAVFPGGLSVAPTIGGIVSRAIVDAKYNDDENPAIFNLHAEAAPRVMQVGAPVGHTTVGCADLNTAALASLWALGHRELYVDCNPSTSVDFSGFTSVVFAGDLTIGQSNIVAMPEATNVTVRGAINIQSGRLRMASVRDFTVGNGISISNNGGMAVNSTTADSCAGREGPAWTNWAKMTVFGGSPAFSTAGNVALCQTAVYLAGPKKASFEAQKTVGTGCAADQPCPKVTGNTVTDADFALLGGTIHWSAPNQHNVKVEGSAVGLEDLALWTEGAGTSEIKSGAVLLATGVYFGPNANFEIRSPATGAPRDAQFVARKAWLFQGTLRVAPNPVNSVLFPVAGDYGLIR